MLRRALLLAIVLLFPALICADEQINLLQNVQPEGDLKLDWVWQPTLANRLLLVSVHRDGVVNLFSRDAKTGEIKFLKVVEVRKDILRNDTVRHMDPHVVLTAKNIMYVAGEWTHAHDDHDNIGLTWYQIDPKDGSSQLLGHVECPCGVLYASPNPAMLYLSDPFSHQIYPIALDADGKPSVGKAIEGKGLGGTMVASPEKKFFYSIGPDAVAWLSCDADGKLAFLDSTPLPDLPPGAKDPHLFVSPDGAHVYAAFHTGEYKHQTEYIALFQRDATKGSLKFDQKLDADGLAGVSQVIFTPDGTHAYYCGLPESPSAGLGTLDRDPGTGKLAIHPRIKGSNPAFFIAYAPDTRTIYLGGYWSQKGFKVFRVQDNP